VASRPGLAGEIDVTFAELSRCGTDVAAVCEKLAGNESGRGEAPSASGQRKHRAGGDSRDGDLRAKFHDLNLINRAYTQFVQGQRIDANGRMDRAIAAVADCPMFRDATVYVDSYYDFTHFERRLLVAVAAACRQMFVTMMIDPASPGTTNIHWLPDELSPLHRTQEAFRLARIDLETAGVKTLKPVILSGRPRFATQETARLEASFARPALAPAEENGLIAADGPASLFDSAAASLPAAPDHVVLVEAADIRGEVEAVARQIGRWTSPPGGLRYRDIVVLVRDPGAYADLIESMFREHGIPLFMDRRRSASHHPLTRYLRGVLPAAFRSHGSDDLMIALLKSGLAGLDFDESDELENAAIARGIVGAKWWHDKSWAGGDNAPRISELRQRLLKPLRPLREFLARKGSMAARELAVEIISILERAQVRQQIEKWMEQARESGRLDLRSEHEQAWAGVCAMLQETVDLLGDQTCTVDDFQAILEVAMDAFDLAITPPTVDQVLVGEVDRTRAPAVAATVVMGLCDGSFPRTAQPRCVLNDVDRMRLRHYEVRTDADSRQRTLEENFLAYIAFSRSTRFLMATRPLRAGESAGAETKSSIYWARLIELFPQISVTGGDNNAGELDTIATPRQLVTSLLRWARNQTGSLASTGTTSAASDPKLGLYNWLARHPVDPDGTNPVDAMRGAAWKALAYGEDRGQNLSSALAGQLFASVSAADPSGGPVLYATAEQLESFHACPFQHFASYGLGLRDRPESDFTGKDLSRLYHDAMKRIMHRLIEDGRPWSALADDELTRLADEVATAAASAMARAPASRLDLDDPRHVYVTDRLRGDLADLIAAQREMHRNGRFRPFRADVSFGEGGSSVLPPVSITTPAGHRLLITGFIDRIDVQDDATSAGGPTHAALFDYRMRGARLQLSEVHYGLALRLAVWMLAVEVGGIKLRNGGLTASAALSVALLRKVEDAANPAGQPKPGAPEFHLRNTPRGIVSADAVNLFIPQLQTGRSKIISVQLNKSGEFGNRQTTDIVTRAELHSLLKHVTNLIGRSADQILAGEIDVKPYRLGTQSPCPRCSYRPVCRFEPRTGIPNRLVSLKRLDVLDQALASRGGELPDK
jgi:ATP-dependent helicase/nuclease subunit B